MKNFLQKIYEWLKPRYHELMTYQSAVICILVFISYPGLRNTYSHSITDNYGAWVLPVSIIAAIGLIYSIWHVFTSRKKTMMENYFMSAFILSVNGLVGVVAGIELLPTRWSIMVLFPIWNILSGVILLYQLGISENVVTDENATMLEVKIATVTILIAFLIAKFLSHLSWAMTFSVCLFYSSITTAIISRMFYYFQPKQLSKKHSIL